MKELFGLEMRLKRDVDLELLEHILVHVREDDGRVRLTVRELCQLLHGDLGGRVACGADAQRDEHLVGVQARVVVAEVFDLQMLDRLDDVRRDERDVLRDAAKVLERIEQAGGARAEQGGGLAGDDRAVGHLDGDGRRTGLLGALERRAHDRAVIRRQTELVEQQLLPLRLDRGAQTAQLRAGGGVVAAQNFLFGGGAADIVVADAVARHVHAHVRGAFIGRAAVDALEHGVEHGEDLHVAVVVDGRHAVGLEVEGVDHVHGVAQRQIPDRERLELGVARAHTALVLVVELAQAGGHLAAAGAGRSHDDEAARRLDVVVAAEAVVADDARNVGRVVRNDVVAVYADAEHLEPVLEFLRCRLTAVVRDDDAADIEPAALKGVDQAQHIQIVGDAVVAAHLAADDVLGADDDDDLSLLLELQKHLQLGVRLKAGQHAGSVVIVEQLAAEFQIQLIVKLLDALADMLGLHRKIFVVVKSYFHRSFPLWWPGTPYPGFKITNISIPQPVVGCNAKQSAERNSGRIGRFGRYIVLFFVKMVPVQNAKGTAAVCGSPLCSYEELSVWRKKMACYFASAGWVFLTRLRITAPSTLPTASATQYSAA